MSKTVVLTWDLPTTRKEGGPLALDEISNTEVQISLDGGTNFVNLDFVDSIAPQTIQGGDLQFGTYFFRFIVNSTDGQSSDPLDFPVDVPDASVPGQVVNVQVSFS